MPSIKHTIQVDLAERSYPIYIGSGLLAKENILRQHINGSQVMVVTNPTVMPLYMDRVMTALTGLQISQVILPDGEQFKTVATLEKVFDQLLAEGHNRTTTLVALGGGVVGDMCGFAAACYQRGVAFVQIPTTLLAQVDSSVGGKTGVNHPLGKNMIGAFHQPNAVIVDTDTLQTLPAREFSAGLAEVIKYGLISDASFYEWLCECIEGLLARDEVLIAEAIERSCSIKAAVVAADEREGGVRAILNYGHTFGHAIETAEGYGVFLHGEAVAIGMMMALKLSVAMGRIEVAEISRLQTLLEAAGLPVQAPEGMSPERFLELMAVDKKVIDGKLRLVLLDRIGSAMVTSDVPQTLLLEILSGN